MIKPSPSADHAISVLFFTVHLLVKEVPDSGILVRSSQKLVFSVLRSENGKKRETTQWSLATEADDNADRIRLRTALRGITTGALIGDCQSARQRIEQTLF